MGEMPGQCNHESHNPTASDPISNPPYNMHAKITGIQEEYSTFSVFTRQVDRTTPRTLPRAVPKQAYFFKALVGSAAS